MQSTCHGLIVSVKVERFPLLVSLQELDLVLVSNICSQCIHICIRRQINPRQLIPLVPNFLCPGLSQSFSCYFSYFLSLVHSGLVPFSKSLKVPYLYEILIPGLECNFWLLLVPVPNVDGYNFQAVHPNGESTLTIMQSIK